jgi:hypothetical protein
MVAQQPDVGVIVYRKLVTGRYLISTTSPGNGFRNGTQDPARRRSGSQGGIAQESRTVQGGMVRRDTLELGKGLRVSSVSPFSAAALIVHVVGLDSADINIGKT